MGILSIKLGPKSRLSGAEPAQPFRLTSPISRLADLPTVRFVVPGAPVSTNQGYSPACWGKRVGFRLNSDGQEFKARLLNAARRAWMDAGQPDPLPQAQVSARIFFPTRGSDLDGPCKFLLDCLAPAGLIVNDNRIRRVVLEKPAPDGDPRVEIAVGPLAARCPHCGCSCGGLQVAQPTRHEDHFDGPIPETAGKLETEPP